MPSSAFDQFAINISLARNLYSLAGILKSQATPALDTSDILRGAFVMGVSALDLYVHERVRLGVLEIYEGRRLASTSYSNYKVSLRSVTAALQDPNQSGWLDEEIRSQHAVKTFQKCDKIAEVCRLISDVPLWERVASTLGRDSRSVRLQLDLIIDRRNKIAHEMDIDPTSPDSSRWPIDGPLVDESLS